jgi:hypothetical protein
MTQSGRSYLDENFAPNRRGNVHILEVEPAAECVNYERLHWWSPYGSPTIRQAALSGAANSEIDSPVEAGRDDDCYSLDFSCCSRAKDDTIHKEAQSDLSRANYD